MRARAITSLAIAAAGAALIGAAAPSHAFPTEDVDIRVSASGADAVITVATNGADGSGFYFTAVTQDGARYSNDPLLGGPPATTPPSGYGSLTVPGGASKSMVIYVVGGKLAAPDYAFDGYTAVRTCALDCTVSPTVLSVPDLVRG